MTTEFVPLAGDTHVLQNPKNAARDWFMAIASANLERVTRGQTAQGFWVIGPDGTFYGYNNNRSKERVEQMLDRALAKFRQSPPKLVAPTREELAAPSAAKAPQGSSVVRVYARVRPVPAGCADSNKRVSRDHLWISAEEVAALRGRKIPSSLVGRIARFHLVDNVRGEPDMWSAAEVRKLDVHKSAFVGATARFEVAFSLATDGNKRGYEGRLEIELKSDERNRVVRFRGFASGTAWGAGTYTPDPPTGKFNLAIAMVETEDEVAKAVPPQGILWGREYWQPGVDPIMH